MSHKGAIVISETMLLAFGIVVSFILLSSMGSMIFSGQSEAAEESALAFVAKDIAATVDRVAAEAGSIAIVYEVPKGMRTDVKVEYKRITVTAEDDAYSAPFLALTHTNTYELSRPKYICIVKNQDDMRIALSKDKCICNTNDDRCDPACVVDASCDPDCNDDGVADNVCDRRCSAEADGICDRDCFTNDKDKVNEARDCIKTYEEDGKGYKRSDERERICDADSHMKEDGVCDIDCLNNGTSSEGFCDVDCNKYNMTDVNGTFVTEDGYCDLDCGFTGTTVKRLARDGVCDLDCAGPVNATTGDWLDRVENGICDPDCGGLYDPDCGKCANEGDDCSTVPCCGLDMGLDLACCPGTKTCADNSDPYTPACDGNGWCEISPFSSAPEDLTKNVAKWPKGVEGTHPKNWENPYNTVAEVPGHTYKDCTDATDGTCYGESYCSSDFPPWAAQQSGGVYDEDCAGAGDGCAWICQMAINAGEAGDCGVTNFVPGGTDRSSSDTPGFCSTTDDGFCDTDCNLAKWKRWDPDCGEPNCEQKVDKGPWTAAVCADDGSMWYKTSIQVCTPAVMDFLDRRGWNIGQIMRNLMADSPDGWAFDYDRYYVPDKSSSSSCDVQGASLTINTNEAYNKGVKECCAPKGSGCYDGCQTVTNSSGQPVSYVDGCCGVGFCADHSTALLSILRTLGVPAHNVWSAFNNHHAWIAFQCNSSIKNLGKYGNYQIFQDGQFVFDECNIAGDGNWIAIDATFHGTYNLVPGAGHCGDLKEFWNDNGRYGLQGIVCDGRQIIPNDADNCEVSGGSAVCDCPWCNPLRTPPMSCVINHPHGRSESCTVLAGEVSCPFRRNPEEAGGNVGC